MAVDTSDSAASSRSVLATRRRNGVQKVTGPCVYVTVHPRRMDIGRNHSRLVAGSSPRPQTGLAWACLTGEKRQSGLCSRF